MVHAKKGVRSGRTPIKIILPLILAGGLRGGWFFLPRSHGNHCVFPFLIIELGNAQDELILADAELCSFANRQKHRMLIIDRADAVDHMLGLQNIFLAKKLFNLLILSISTNKLSGNRLAAFFLHAAKARIHTQQRSLLIIMLFGYGYASGEQADEG